MDNIFAEDIEKGRAFLSGFYKFNEGELFNQALLALTQDSLLIYNDHAPDSVVEDAWNYSVKKRHSLQDIKMVINEIIINYRDLSGLNRLAIVLQDSKVPDYYYYFNKNKAKYKNFIAGLKHYGVSVQTRKVDLSVS